MELEIRLYPSVGTFGHSPTLSTAGREYHLSTTTYIGLRPLARLSAFYRAALQLRGRSINVANGITLHHCAGATSIDCFTDAQRQPQAGDRLACVRVCLATIGKLICCHLDCCFTSLPLSPSVSLFISTALLSGSPDLLHLCCHAVLSYSIVKIKCSSMFSLLHPWLAQCQWHTQSRNAAHTAQRDKGGAPPSGLTMFNCCNYSLDCQLLATCHAHLLDPTRPHLTQADQCSRPQPPASQVICASCAEQQRKIVRADQVNFQ